MDHSLYTLDALLALLNQRFPGVDLDISQREFGDGSSVACLSVDRQVRAAWRGRLIAPPPLDGVTPRGPKEYFDLRFYPKHDASAPSVAEVLDWPAARARVHELKTWPEFFAAVVEGWKPFEIRQNDRGFRVGDLLLLREYLPDEKKFSGRECKRRVTYITEWEQKPGTVVMALVPA